MPPNISSPCSFLAASFSLSATFSFSAASFLAASFSLSATFSFSAASFLAASFSLSLLYAGAQKNLGPAGVTLVIIRRDFMETARTGLTSMLDYRAHAAKGSRLNTPPTFGIYVMGRVFRWILDQGGIGPLAKANDDKARIVYDAIDRSGGFYRGVARPDCRSVMNVCFRTPTPDLDGLFVEGALAAGMSGLKGHRSVGGLRASIYNACPRAACTALAEFMNDFRDRHG